MVLVAAACGGEAEEIATDDAEIVSSTYRMPDFRETVLASDAAGKISIVQLGDASKVTRLRTTLGAALVGTRSRGGKFWVLSANAKLAAIDPVRGTLGKVATLTVHGARDLELESDDVAWVSARDDARVVRVRMATGATEDSVSLSDRAIDRGRVRPQGMTRVGDRLFVHIARETKAGVPQRGALAVIDVPTKRVVKSWS